MSTSHNIPHYKTLDIVTYYNEVYDFVSKYLIFVVAGILSIIGVLIIWIREPESDVVLSTTQISTWDADAFVQEAWLIYPVNYFAARTIDFDSGNKIYGLWWPVWSTLQQWSTKKLRNSIDNIVLYNGIILPREISRSAWVPKFQQEYYSDSMIAIFLSGMAYSRVDINSIVGDMSKANKETLPKSMLDTFRIWCTNRNLLITQFCDLKLHDTMPIRNKYDLSGSISELTTIKDYIFNISKDISNQESFCNIMIKQYRYSGSPQIANLITQCAPAITNEVNYIRDMMRVNQEVSSHSFTDTVYNNTTINQYKLMSRYQYLMDKVKWGEYIDAQDDNILRNYDSYITQIAKTQNNDISAQPYGDIITIFHKQYLIPWLEERESYASNEQKAITQKIINTTNLIINGDSTLWIESVTKWSRIQSIDFLISKWLYDPNDPWSSPRKTPVESDPNNQTSSTGSTINQNTGSITITEPAPSNTTSSTETKATPPSLNELITKVLGIEPTSFKQNGDLVIIQYPYKGKSWFAAVNIKNKWDTQLYYNSDISGAVKITHPKVIFNSSDTELIMAIMNNFLSTNPQ